MAEPKTEQEVIARFQEMRQGINLTMNQLAKADEEAAEHDLVIKQLEPMDKSRKCYRLIGDVLVERTVAETLPAVKRNREGLAEVMKQFQQDVQQKQKALADYVNKYKIRPAGPGDDEDEPSGASSSKPKQSKQGSTSGGGSSSSKGVLA